MNFEIPFVYTWTHLKYPIASAFFLIAIILQILVLKIHFSLLSDSEGYFECGHEAQWTDETFFPDKNVLVEINFVE